ncbi:MAG: hypothetical protein V2A62_00535 [Candidatus Woesearchaeota archaeon]
MDINYKIIVLEDQESTREGIRARLQRSFENLALRRPELQRNIPTISAYASLDQLFNQEVPQESTFYSWVTDWNLDAKDIGEKTSAAVYTALANLLGGYSEAKRDQRNHELDDDWVTLEHYQCLLSEVSPENRNKLNRILKNSGAFVIYSAHTPDAIFRSDVCLAFTTVGTVNAPLVLYQSKDDLNLDVHYIALGCLIAERAYGGFLPQIGSKTDPTDSLRRPLPESLAQRFQLARSEGSNNLTHFLTECSLKDLL